MASFSALNAMTVPGSDGGTGKIGLLMPKLQYRFRVLFTGIGVNDNPIEVTKQMIDVTRPNVSFPEIPIEIYNSRVYLAGKPTWEPVTFNVRDSADGSIAKIIGKQVQKQMDFQEQASAAAGVDYKFKMQIQILDGGNSSEAPVVLEQWELYGCYLSAINYNSLNYATNEPVTISCTVRYDNALQYADDKAQDNIGYGAYVKGTTGSTAGSALGVTP
jgi:hypothetical protein